MVSVEEFRKAQLAEGPATIMAIGTATPPNCVLQSTYPDYYFRITKSEHKKELKEKFRRICDKSMVKKRYMCLTEEILKEKPNFIAHMAPSLDERQEVAIVEIPKLGAEAATQAIKEWGQPKSNITHVVFCTTTGVDMPGADRLSGDKAPRPFSFSQTCDDVHTRVLRWRHGSPSGEGHGREQQG